MKFMTVREFRGKTGMVRESLKQDEEIILTTGGKPFALVSVINPEFLDKELLAVRRARAKVALERIQSDSARTGTCKMTISEIDSIIQDSRRRTRYK